MRGARLALVALLIALGVGWGRPTPSHAGPPMAPAEGIASGDIVIAGMSAMQAQYPHPGNNAPGFVPLIADKETMVRVSVAVDGVIKSEPRDVTVTLTAKVNNEISPPCQPLFISQTKSLDNVQAQGFTLDEYISQKLIPDLSLNFTFQLPSWCWWLDAGTIQITATATGDECAGCAGNNVRFRDFTFEKARPALVLFHPIGYGIPYPEVTPDGIDELVSRYPVPSVTVFEAPLVFPPDDLRVDLVTGRKDGKGGTPTDAWWDQYVKLADWFADCCDDDFPVDAQVGLLLSDTVGCYGVGGFEGRYALSGAGCGGAYAHELGHVFGLPHSGNDHGECDGGSCDKEWGWPHGGLGKRAWNRLSPSKFIDGEGEDGEGDDWHGHDFMSYGDCSADAPTYGGSDPTYCKSWPSEHNYVRIAQQLRCAFPQWDKPDNWKTCYYEDGPFAPLLAALIPSPGSAEAPPRPGDRLYWLRLAASVGDVPAEPEVMAQTAATESLRVSASIGPDGKAELRPFYHRVGRARVADPNAPGSVTLELRGPDDRVLARRNVEPTRLVGHAPIRRWRLDAEIPWHPATRRVLLKRGGDVLAERSVSATAPTVRLLTPNGGERLGAAGEVRVEWWGQDGDGDGLRYWLQYSADDGRTWLTIHRNTRDAHYTLRLDQLAGSSRARFRVLASDGIRTASDDSDGAFQIATKPPRVGFHGGTAARGDEDARDPSILRGWALDADEGSLPEERLTWTSDLQGQLGIGEALRLSTLRPGRHQLTLTATDRDGQQGSATRTVTIGR